MMYMVLISALVAAVSAEADPQLLGHHGVVGLKSAPCVNAFNLPVPCNVGYAGIYGGGLFGRKKREADPQILGHGIGLKSAPCVNAFNHPVPCNVGYAGVYGAGVYGAGVYGAGLHGAGLHGAGLYGRKKREADPQFLGASVYGGYGHAIAATPYGLTHSANVGFCHNFVGARVPC